VEAADRPVRDHLDRDRIRLVHGDVLHDAVLAHLRKTEPVHRDLPRHAGTLFQGDAEDGRPVHGTETEQKIPVVAPPAGADVFLIARLWDWWPILELEKGKTYRLHLTSMDYQHGFSLQPENINVQVLPGYEHVVTVTPNRSGVYAIVCNEFCGIGHHKMVSKLYVK
jgi:hypothetical protein